MRPTLLALATSLALCMVCSIVGAVGVPSSPLGRIALVTSAWCALAVLVAYVFLPRFDLPWRTLHRLPRGRPSAIALTIDDGPHPESTPAVLDALRSAGVRATFFLVGAAVERWPELAARIVREGHAIANHTQQHRILLLRTPSQLADEVDRCQCALASLKVPVRHFRPPQGWKPIGLHRLLRARGLRLVSWSGSIRDTDAPGVRTIVDRAVRLAHPGRILLLHDNPTCHGQTAAAIPLIAARCRARGLEFVVL